MTTSKKRQLAAGSLLLRPRLYREQPQLSADASCGAAAGSAYPAHHASKNSITALGGIRDRRLLVCRSTSSNRAVGKHHSDKDRDARLGLCMPAFFFFFFFFGGEEGGFER